MSEPTNPLFEEEKEFLERKKLEYERALRGDVEHIKEQTAHVGKLALIGAGVASGIWLLTKAFGGRKRKKWHYADEDEADYNFGENGYYNDDSEERGNERSWGANRYDDSEMQDYADDSDEAGALADDDDLDDNGLSEFPEFEAHSSSHHGSERATDYHEAPADADDTFGDVYHTGAAEPAAPAEERPFWSAEHSHPTANDLPYDDSRRIPASDSFTGPTPAEEVAQASPQAKGKWLFPLLKSFMQTETGRVLAGQAAAVALAMATKVVQDMLPKDKDKDKDKTAKTSDLAASTAAAGARAYGKTAPPPAPQSPVLDAQDPDADTSATLPPPAQHAG